MVFQCNKKQQLVLSVKMILVSCAILLLVHVDESHTFDLVTTGNSSLAPDGRHVGVHLPGILKLDLDTRGPAGSRRGVRMTQTVLMGLVKVSVDRVNGTDNKMHGPIRVTMFGIPIYDNRESPITESTSDSSINDGRNTLTDTNQINNLLSNDIDSNPSSETSTGTVIIEDSTPSKSEGPL